MTQIGTVIATSESPSLDLIVMVLNKKNKSLVEKGQFVTIPKNSSSNVLGIIFGIKMYNTYFETLDPSIHEITSRKYETIFPVEEWESTIAEIKPLGELDLQTDKINRLKFPVSPGSKAYISSASDVSKFLGLDNNGVFLGSLTSNNVKVKINLSRLLRKHLAILAISGAGKSYATSIILEEIIFHGKLGVVVIDPHGEYSSLMPSNAQRGSIEVIKSSFISIGVPELSAWEIADFLPDISVVQTRVLDSILSRFKREKNDFYGLQDIIHEVENSEGINPRTKDALVGWLDSLQRTYLFSAKTSPDLLELMHPGKMIIVDLSDTLSLWRRQIIVLFLLNRLYNLRMKEKIPPSLLVIEEAHQFCLSEDTELLTSKGWKNYTDIKVGDFAFSYNTVSKTLELAKIKRLIIRNYEGEMIKLFNENGIDALITKDHRVLCNYRTIGRSNKSCWSNDSFLHARNLPNSIRIPLTAECTRNGKCNIDDDLLKIIGWILTSGQISFNNNENSRYEITQSENKNNILQEMTKIIKRKYPETGICVQAKEDEKIRRKADITFHLKKKASQEIDFWLLKEPNRIPREILEKSDLSQLKILFNAMVHRDGNIQQNKTGYRYITYYTGKNKGLADDFQELCTKIGLSAIKKFSPQKNQYKVLVSFRRKFAYIKKSTTEFYSGKVWDITINNGAFIARRNGRVFITGNCPESSRSISKRIIETIAREGRKFYISLCLISQRPINLSVTALSQCNTNLIFRIRNPYDQDFIAKTSEGIDRSNLKMIPSLEIGEALLVGEAINYPTFFKIRSRTFINKEISQNLEEMAEQYEKEWRLRNKCE